MRVVNTLIQTRKVSLHNHLLKGNFKLNPIYTKQVEMVDQKTYILILNFSVLNSPEFPFPVDLSVSLSGTFVFEDGTQIDKIEGFMKGPAVQIIYPHLRSLVSSLTASSYLQPLLLPLVNPEQFANV